MQNKRTLFKVGCGAVAASAIAAGVIFEVIQSDKISQFNGNGEMSTQDYEFMSYVSTYGKNFPTKSEYKMRASNWATADAAITAHNDDPAATSKVGHNFLSTYSSAEKKMMTGYKGPVSPTSTTDTSLSGPIPSANGIDWNAKGMVTAVQN